MEGRVLGSEMVLTSPSRRPLTVFPREQTKLREVDNLLFCRKGRSSFAKELWSRIRV